MFNVIVNKNDLIIKNADNFDLGMTLDCGQAFRWTIDENNHWKGIAFNKCLEIYNENNDIVLKNTDLEDFNKIWKHYFDLSRDYSKIIELFKQNDILNAAANYGNGIRILNQDPWETLCSFIISQNNNIPRIKGIIERLCQNFGEKCGFGYTFPTAEKIALLTVDDLSVLRSGFRAKYIIDAAQKVASGEVNLENLKFVTLGEAREELMKIKGVGPKVADCVSLFSLEHFNSFPKDVWIKRAMDVLFGGELPEIATGYEGIAQQYIFYYARMTKLQI